MNPLKWIVSTVLLGALTVVLGVAACSTQPNGGGFANPNSSSGSSGEIDCSASFGGCDGGADAPKVCVGLECDIHTCNGVQTTVRGKVYDPGGTTPLYNVVVYIPNSPPPPITVGATCDKCGATALNPVPKAALTDEKGEFVIEGAPDGAEIPLVMQVGKWRRQIKIKVDKCVDNKFEDKNIMRLPRNKSEGDMPQIALTTGGCDPLGCLFSRMGIDASEFTGSSGDGKVHVYKGTGGQSASNGVALDPQAELWNDVEKLKKYDIVLLSCECNEYPNTKPPAAKDAMRDYLNLGGRVFATHYHYEWFKNGPAELKGLANWGSGGGGSGSSYLIDQGFPKGKAMAEWLSNIGATPVKGSIALTGTANDVAAVNAGAQRWISGPGSAASVKYFSFNTPVGAQPDKQCGRGVMSDIHVSSGGSGSGGSMPTSCGSDPLTPQERALEFMFFDLSSCVQRDDVPPVIPQ
jgi:hypothetical protein